MTKYTSRQQGRERSTRRTGGDAREEPRYKSNGATTAHGGSARGRGGRDGPRGRARGGASWRGSHGDGERGGASRRGSRGGGERGGVSWRGRGKPPRRSNQRRWKDSSAFEDMKNNPAIDRFLKSREFKKSVLGGSELADFLQDARDVEVNDTLRHQFMRRLIQSPFLETTGPVMGTMIAWMREPPTKEEGERACSALLDIVDEMLESIPYNRNTIPYTTTVLDMLCRVDKILKLDLGTRISTLQTLSQCRTSLPARATWSPDSSFIDEAGIPEKLTDLLQTALDEKFTNPVCGAHASNLHYLETWYRMMREDFMAPLRKALSQYRDTFTPSDVPIDRRTGRVRLDGGFHYYFPRILACERDGEDMLYRLELFGMEGEDWSATDRLNRHNSLLLLSSDHFETVRHALVTLRSNDRNSRDIDARQQESGSVWVRVQGNPLYRTAYHGIEPTALWEPTRCVLERLQQLAKKVNGGEALPFQRYIVEAHASVRPPTYVTQNETAVRQALKQKEAEQEKQTGTKVLTWEASIVSGSTLQRKFIISLTDDESDTEKEENCSDTKAVTADVVDDPLTVKNISCNDTDGENAQESFMDKSETALKAEIVDDSPKTSACISEINDTKSDIEDGEILGDFIASLESGAAISEVKDTSSGMEWKEIREDFNEGLTNVATRQVSPEIRAIRNDMSMAVPSQPLRATTVNADVNDLGLDSSQAAALQLALTHELALIQGPPGTGKSRVGAMFVKIMMLNKPVWQRYEHGRILLLSYKNHAIDQFLRECEGLGVDMTNTVRVGAGSDDDMGKYLLKNKRRDLRSYNEYEALNRDANNTRLKIGATRNKVNLFKRHAGCLSANIPLLDYRNVIPDRILTNIMNWTDNELRYVHRARKGWNHGREEDELEYEYTHEKRWDCKYDLDDSEESKLARLAFEQTLLAWVVDDVELEQKDIKYVRSRIDQASVIDQARAIRLSERDIHTMSFNNRRNLYRHWCELAKTEAEHRHAEANDRLEKLLIDYKRLTQTQDFAVVHRADIVALTTTGASKYSHILEAAQPTIVLCEEAAEVLEPHITASLTASCQHLVLIGDHVQLRPTANHYPMETRRNYTISLFERLVNNKVPSQQLCVQHRMHPDIAAILVPHIYKTLEHHETVFDYQPVRGMARRVHYLQHNNQENEVDEKTGRCNEYEANFLVHLAHYLLLQGYPASDITILTTYKGQMRLIREFIKTFCQVVPEPRLTVQQQVVLLDQDFPELMEQESNSRERLVGRRETSTLDSAYVWNMKQEYKRRKEEIETTGDKSKLLAVRVSTVDNFQGEENKIILLSFVRSNGEGRIGFLKRSNRICVALSRAKHGFYAIGNFKLFARKSDVWKKICEQLLTARTLNDSLQLKCPHGTIQTVKQPDDFRLLAPDGGCGEACLYRLDCGHVCPRFCHPDGDDPKHKQFTCKKKCEGKLDCGHICGRVCTKFGHSGAIRRCSVCRKTIDCLVKIEITPPCNHIGETRCGRESVYKCRTPVDFSLPCGHSQTHPCYSDCSGLVCKETVTEKLEACGHEIKRLCPKPAQPCKTKITVNIDCGHKFKTECWRRNHEKVCVERVFRMLECEHSCVIECYRSKEKVICSVPVPVSLPCGHEKMVACEESQRPLMVDQKCAEPVKVKRPCGHKEVVPCSQKDEERGPCQRKVKKIWTICRHSVTVLCHAADELKTNGCMEMVKRRLLCGHDVLAECGRNDHDLPECQKRCKWSCPHGRCRRRCGQRCSRCTLPCRNWCVHSRCTRPCWEPCDRGPCQEGCGLRLKCGHRCSGLCGEPCPEFCPKCLNQPPALMIRLSPCDHELPVQVMDQHMWQYGPAQRFCPLPDCNALITDCPRYQAELKMARAFSYDRRAHEASDFGEGTSSRDDQSTFEQVAERRVEEVYQDEFQPQPGPSSRRDTDDDDSSSDLVGEDQLLKIRPFIDGYLMISDTDSSSDDDDSSSDLVGEDQLLKIRPFIDGYRMISDTDTDSSSDDDDSSSDLVGEDQLLKIRPFIDGYLMISDTDTDSSSECMSQQQSTPERSRKSWKRPRKSREDSASETKSAKRFRSDTSDINSNSEERESGSKEHGENEMLWNAAFGV